MAIGTLQSIIGKIRRLTGTGTDFQLTDAMIKDYIDSFYLYDFPAQFRSLKLQDRYTFNTTRGINVYPFDSEHYTTVSHPATVAKRPIGFFTSPSAFYTANYTWQYQQQLTTADGTAGPFGGFTNARPVIRSVNNNPANTVQATPSQIPYPVSRVQNLLITTNINNGLTLNVTDDGEGNLIGDCVAGTIDYATGEIAGLVFSMGTIAGSPIVIQYNPTILNIPQSILFFQNQFTLMPVPDQGYTVEMLAYRQPSQALEDTGGDQGIPELIEWWETIAFGAAKKIFQDRLDLDGVRMMDSFLQEAYLLNLTRTCAEISTQSIPTIFKAQISNSQGYPGFGTIFNNNSGS